MRFTINTDVVPKLIEEAAELAWEYRRYGSQDLWYLALDVAQQVSDDERIRLSIFAHYAIPASAFGSFNVTLDSAYELFEDEVHDAVLDAFERYGATVEDGVYIFGSEN